MIVTHTEDGSFKYTLSSEELKMDPKNFAKFIDFAIEESRKKYDLYMRLSEKLANDIERRSNESIAAINREKRLLDETHKELKTGLMNIFKESLEPQEYKPK